MVWALIAALASALGFAGTAVTLAITGSKSKSESFRQKAFAKEAQYQADEFEEQLIQINHLRGADKKEINALNQQIKGLRRLVRIHAPDGAAAEQFERMLQEAAGQDRDSDEDDSSADSMSDRGASDS